MSKRKKMPEFKTSQEESDFWNEHDSTEYIDWTQAEAVKFVNLKPSTQKISLRLPEALLNELKILAHKGDIPYQSLIKLFLAQSVRRELQHK